MGSTNSREERGRARVPSGCSCLNVERADIFVVDRREGERWFPTGLLLCARSYDPRRWSLGEDETEEKEIIFCPLRENLARKQLRAKPNLQSNPNGRPCPYQYSFPFPTRDLTALGAYPREGGQ